MLPNFQSRGQEQSCWLPGIGLSLLRTAAVRDALHSTSFVVTGIFQHSVKCIVHLQDSKSRT